jgi:DNA-binding transcriptional LysR family regulator
MYEPWALYPPATFVGRVTRSVFANNGLEVPRATVTTPSAFALCMFAATGPFLTIHPRTLLRAPQMHSSLTAIAVDMRPTRSPISLVTLKNRSLSPAAKLFTEIASSTAKTIKH